MGVQLPFSQLMIAEFLNHQQTPQTKELWSSIFFSQLQQFLHTFLYLPPAPIYSRTSHLPGWHDMIPIFLMGIPGGNPSQPFKWLAVTPPGLFALRAPFGSRTAAYESSWDGWILIHSWKRRFRIKSFFQNRRIMSFRWTILIFRSVFCRGHYH